MKLKNKTKLISLPLFLFLGLVLWTCGKAPSVLIVELEIEELVCADGQRIFEGRILELDGIKSVTANIKLQKAQIKYKDNLVSAVEIENHLAAFGFTIDGVPGNAVARSRLPGCCLNPKTGAQ
ncbi:MAG: heavy-metal-associated domain-containing protein [Candidatus Marinimicrobia bacterium]|nr:heavy-metal-associated domain-containing protein [Candidatus Neomarinimicrobiota bacterium]